MARSPHWTRDQLLLALRLYMHVPFGRLHTRNPEIIALSKILGRTPGAVTMKATNFASIDPKLDRKGLSNSGAADKAIWDEFATNPTRLALEAEEAAERLQLQRPDAEPEFRIPRGASEKETLVKVRRVQSFFRAALMVSYDGKCAISGIAIPELLIASHIIPWKDSEDRRADPTNGILLNALFDKAFDHGWITFDTDDRVLVSSKFSKSLETAELDCSLLEIHGRALRVPNRFRPDPVAMRHHRESIFRG
jgi:putative restriction endonuclease